MPLNVYYRFRMYFPLKICCLGHQEISIEYNFVEKSKNIIFFKCTAGCSALAAVNLNTGHLFKSLNRTIFKPVYNFSLH